MSKQPPIHVVANDLATSILSRAYSLILSWPDPDRECGREPVGGDQAKISTQIETRKTDGGNDES